MVKNRELHLRLSISLVFAIVVLAPLFFIVSDLNHISGRLWQQQLEVAQQSLKEELADFRKSLIPRQFVENLIKRAEIQLGLVSATMNHPIFPQNQEAGIFTAATIGQLCEFYQKEAGIQPLAIVTFNTDFTDIWSWFNQSYGELRDFPIQHRKRFEAVVPFIVADTATFSAVIANNHKAGESLQNFLFEVVKTGRRERTYHQFFYDYVGDLAYRPPHHGAVYEMATTRFGSRRFFVYNLPVKAGELVYGGYFVMFASRDIGVDQILELATKSSRPGTRRLFYTSPPSGNSTDPDTLRLNQPFPVELAGYSRISGYQNQLPTRIGVELSIKSLRKEHAAHLGSIAFVCRFVIIITLAVAIYFMLFGFPDAFRLRLRMLTIIALSICLPWTMLGYFCLSLFDSFHNLTGHELRADATSSMYRLISYYYDQKLQLNLEILKTKQRIIEHVARPSSELLQMHSHKIVLPDNFFELFFYRDDGMTRAFRSRHPASISSRRADCYLAARYLDHLGILDRRVPTNSKYIDQGDFYSLAIDSLQQSYSEHLTMHRECVETRDWKKADELSRMVYMLLPDTRLPGNPLRAIGNTSTSSPNYILINPGLFVPEIYSQRMPWRQHDFLIGQRRVDDTILRWWPAYVNSSSELKQQLDIAAASRSGGSHLMQNADGNYKFVNRRYISGDSLVFAGISTASQDLRLELLLKLFPFVLLAMTLFCLLLFADLLSAMFIHPVSGFQKATAEITAGNYQVAVQMPDSDEFSLLASSFNRMATGLVQREKMRRFVSDNLFEQLGLSASECTKSSMVTLLASDIRGFTSLSEKHEPQQIVSLLNDYFTEMETAIKESGGFIERFVGDAVVAVFYHDQADRPEERALTAAMCMRRRLVALNARRAAAGLFVIDNGIGIATGEAVSGIAGSPDGRQVLSVIGEVTHIAEKLESASRHVGSRILLCQQTAAGVKNAAAMSDVTDLCGLPAFCLVADEVSDD
ncbi:MAG: hypothetical protein CVV42_03480 [Candidatus Riflebacteria bacterium HGW-Riflebacteria-2]|jgi:class 3 adenylate cyclase|nr:MAG: hypothetical protein CVV42_03480 [Candidatus Riflebacteria bacterium HGW-Riflebacteria-2]